MITMHAEDRPADRATFVQSAGMRPNLFFAAASAASPDAAVCKKLQSTSGNFLSEFKNAKV
jgi:hypothetical protein